jgi:hypothetical protein
MPSSFQKYRGLPVEVRVRQMTDDAPGDTVELHKADVEVLLARIRDHEERIKELEAPDAE